MTMRSPMLTARPRLRRGFRQTLSVQRITSAWMNPLPQGIHTATMLTRHPSSSRRPDSPDGSKE